MSVEYYHLSPVILTDDVFFPLTPPLTESGTFGQRQVAYLAAEQQAMQAIGTFLIPTTVTGSFIWPIPPKPIILPHDRVQSIDRVAVYGRDDLCSCDLTAYDGCGLIRDSYGYIDLVVTEGYWRSSCGCAPGGPYRVEVTYTAGLPTGTAANDTSLHMGLAIAARLNLWEMVEPGALEGGAGDAGVQSYGTLGYSETRVPLKNTPFGVSALANKANMLVKHLKRHRMLRFG
jgi:hypothetical protein